jgi:hypothetical protein
MAGPAPSTLEHCVADRLELEQQLLEPQLVDLVDRDEEKLVVRRWIREKALQLEKLGNLQVAAVGQPSILFTESRWWWPGGRASLLAD